MADENEDDSAAFRKAMAGIRPLKANKVAPQPPKPGARASFTRADQRRVLKESLDTAADLAFAETGEELLYRSPALAESSFRKLRRGQFSVTAELDLHGLTQKMARAALNEFLAECALERRACVRIIHGKGKRSGHRGPVLKPAINRWLRRHEPVLGFATARPVDGGTGAVYVLLRRS